MGKYGHRLNTASSQMVNNVLKRYPITLKALKEYRAEVLQSASHGSEWASDPERKARLLASPYCRRLEREKAAVEAALEALEEGERNVIYLRYFGGKDYQSLEYMADDCGYSVRSITRICEKMRFYTGLYLGEVDPETAATVKNKTRKQKLEHSLELMAQLITA